MNGVRLDYQPKTVGEALALAEAHLRAIGYPHMSPVRFVRENELRQDGSLVTAALYTHTELREADLLPGTRIRTGASEIEVVRIIPSQHEVVFKNKHGGLFRMPTKKFVELAKQQGYKKVWNITTFLESLKNLLKPVLPLIPLMWVLKWVVNTIRKKPVTFHERLPKETDKLEE